MALARGFEIRIHVYDYIAPFRGCPQPANAISDIWQNALFEKIRIGFEQISGAGVSRTLVVTYFFKFVEHGSKLPQVA